MNSAELAEPIPDRPGLDRLLEEAGSDLTWQPEARAGKGAYTSPLREFTTVFTATALTRMTSVVRRFEEVPADKVEIDEFERRLVTRWRTSNSSPWWSLLHTPSLPGRRLAGRS